MCAGNELWFSMMYMLYFTEGPAGASEGNPVFTFGPSLFLVLTIGRYSIGLCRCILYAVTPIMVSKQIISLIHLYTAALDMAAIDVAERASKTKAN